MFWDSDRQIQGLICHNTWDNVTGIPTAGTPVRVPSRRIPVPFREEVEVQIQQLLEKGIITESNSPWLAPAVYVRKKTGDIMCGLPGIE